MVLWLAFFSLTVSQRNTSLLLMHSSYTELLALAPYFPASTYSTDKNLTACNFSLLHLTVHIGESTRGGFLKTHLNVY